MGPGPGDPEPEQQPQVSGSALLPPPSSPVGSGRKAACYPPKPSPLCRPPSDFPALTGRSSSPHGHLGLGASGWAVPGTASPCHQWTEHAAWPRSREAVTEACPSPSPQDPTGHGRGGHCRCTPSPAEGRSLGGPVCSTQRGAPGTRSPELQAPRAPSKWGEPPGT